MKTLRIGAIIVGGLLLLVLLAVFTVWMLGGMAINKRYTAPVTGLSHSADADVIARGQHLAKITGCNGCHGQGMLGQIFVELPDGTRFVTPNVPVIAALYTDEDLARVLRYGVRPDGKSVLVMPSEAFFAMPDEDLVAVLSYIRSLDVEANDLPSSKFGLLVRGMLAAGEVKTAAASIGDMETQPVYDFASELDRGAYLATIACAECHGLDLKGQSLGEMPTPDLVVGAAYSPEEFTRLMETGVGVGDRDLGLMSIVAKDRFSHFTETELGDLHAYLIHRAETLE
jgi:mono/diheme cytochrome c family protein